MSKMEDLERRIQALADRAAPLRKLADNDPAKAPLTGLIDEINALRAEQDTMSRQPKDELDEAFVPYREKRVVEGQDADDDEPAPKKAAPAPAPARGVAKPAAKTAVKKPGRR